MYQDTYNCLSVEIYNVSTSTYKIINSTSVLLGYDMYLRASNIIIYVFNIYNKVSFSLYLTCSYTQGNSKVNV